MSFLLSPPLRGLETCIWLQFTSFLSTLIKMNEANIINWGKSMGAARAYGSFCTLPNCKNPTGENSMERTSFTVKIYGSYFPFH